MRSVLLLVPALALSACGTFLAANDVDSKAIEPDGSAPEADAGAILDGATVVDATVSVIDPGDASAPKPCSARFCQSFDDADAGTPFGFKRFGPSSSVVASSGTREDVSLSPPRSFRVVMNQDSTEGWLELDLGDALSGSVHVAMWVDAVPVDESTKVVAVNCEEGDMGRVRIATGMQLGFDSSDDPGTRFNSVPLQKWVALDLDFQKDAPGNGVGAQATLHVGGIDATVGRKSCSPPVRIRIGLTPSAPEPFDVSFDDVAIDWKP